MILPKIALKNLTRQKRRSITLGSALSFGMFILVLVNGVTGGLLKSVQKNFAQLIAGHIFFVQVENGPDGKILNISRDDKNLLDTLASSGIKFSSVTRRTNILGSVIYSGESATRSLTGVDWQAEASFADGLNLIAGDARGMDGSDGILVSDVLAENIGLIQKKKISYAESANLRRDLKIRWKQEGKKFDLEKAVKAETARLEAEREKKQQADAAAAIGETVLAKMQTIYGQENVAEFRVKGIYKAQMDYSAYVDRGVLDACVGMSEDTFNLCGIMLEDFNNLDMKTRRIYDLLKDTYDLVPYEKMAGRAADSIISDLKKEGFTGQKTIITNLNGELGSLVSILSGVQAGSFVLFLIVLAVIMVGLVNTFRMIISERTKEIGTMRALGAQRKQIRHLFLLEAMFLGVIGCVPGALLGAIVLKVLSLLHFDSFTELSMFLDGGHLASTLNPVMLVSSVLIVTVFTLLSALVPALRAARMEPAQALRTQL